MKRSVLGSIAIGVAVVSISGAGAPGVATERSRAAAPEVPAATPIGDPAGYRTFEPTRVLDTRTSGGRLRAGEVATIDVGAALRTQLGNFGGWTAVSANLTAADPTLAGYLTAWPCDQPRPETSNVNFVAGGASSTHSIVAVSASIEFCVYASEDADVIVDVFGGFLSTADRFAVSRLRTVTPQRLFDSRSTPGLVASGSITRITVPVGVVSRGDTAGIVNITAVSPAESGYVSAFPCLTGLTGVSNLNFAAGESAHANGAIVPVDVSRQICLRNEGATEIVVDLFAMFNAWNDPGLLYQAAVPTRLLDTRRGLGGASGPVARNETIAVAVPATASLAVGSVTAVGATADGYLSVWNGEGPPPTVSSLNFAAGATIPNFAIAETRGGRFGIYSGDAGGHHVLFDLTGWFAPE